LSPTISQLPRLPPEIAQPACYREVETATRSPEQPSSRMQALSFDSPLGFVLSMFWRATAVTYLTHLACALLRLRGRCLAHWLQLLLLQADSQHFRGRAGALADAILHHPMIGSPGVRGTAISREQLVLVLLELAESDGEFSPMLKAAFGSPAALGRVSLWFDQAMARATRSYRLQASLVTGLASFCILTLTEDAPFGSLHVLLTQWIALSLGTPFWYDLLKRLMPLLRGAGVGRVRRRPH